MGDQDLRCDFTAPVSIERVYEALSQIDRWWMIGFDGKAREVGDTFRVHSKQMYVDFVVDEAVANRSAVWRVQDCNLHWLRNPKEWTGTRVEWRLTPVADGTAIRLIHYGLRPDVECYAECVEGWNLFACRSLVQYLTTGTGSPDPEP